MRNYIKKLTTLINLNASIDGLEGVFQKKRKKFF